MEEAKKTKDGKPVDAGVSMPHDKGYKKSLSRPEEFLHFLKKYIGADWMLELRATDFVLCDKEMLERDYEGREADLLYRVGMPDGEEVYVFILQELQSSVDYTMIFRILMYVVNTLVKHFLDMDKKTRERAGFRLPAMVPIVFYNGQERWTAVTNLRDYQRGGDIFGNHILNLEYYLVDLAQVEEEYILSTNTVLDNIMYCDKFRKKLELAGAIRRAYGRVEGLGRQELEEFRNWVKYILLSVCGDKLAVVEEILSWAGNGEDDMAFKYNIVRMFEEEREEGKAEGKAEAILDLLGDVGAVPEALREKILGQKDLEILRGWLKLASASRTVEEFENLFMK
ncbi:MAG: Rpn family recombination-promoting nuclease/putative transposase [Lachnospiraceae bacterium]|nr:Rpn family recombination-promoting nuclease/putative transposase [Lachnospiraceae bacterium]